MTRRIAAAILLAAATLAAPVAAAAAAMQLGGARAVSTDDDGVQAAASFAAGELGGSLQSVDSAQAQTVAGVNYRLTITLEDGAVWQVVVHRSLQGEFSLSSSSQQSGGEGETDHGTNDGSDTSGDDE
ncbi:MAG TPA: hypothetical protein VMG08_13755 [Allosphingosinicella sp.]|nr:hypothetical protein [Allosphingosinicella sp.]